MKFILLVTLIIGSTYGFYNDDDYVVELTPSNFESEVLESKELWLIEFYAPWCGHCSTLAPEWKKAADNLQGLASIGAVNADAHPSLGSKYGVQGFPTIKIFGFDKSNPKPYNGARSADAITDAAMKAVREMVEDRKSGKKQGGGGGGQSRKEEKSSSDDVVTLTDSNFRELVLEGKETWFVEFYAPWCGHCKNLAPQWARAATEVKDKTEGTIKLGALDATVHQATAQQYGIRGYPTIKIFKQNEKSSPIDYDGSRDSSGIVNKAMEYYVENIDPPTIYELVSQEVFDENCGTHLCILAFLPDIADDGKDGRNRYIDLLKSLGDRFKKQRWGWAWLPANANPELEKSLKVGGSGYPALVALNKKKDVYALYMGAFSDDGLGPFLNQLTYGRSRLSTHTLSEGKLPEVKPREPWDGKDAPPVEFVDEDLSDFKWDDEL
ncbi:protein disulfide-isomerase A6-like [Ciona intestinalis]